MYESRAKQRTTSLRAVFLPAGVALTLLLAGCGSKTTAAASSSTSSAAAPANTAVSAPVPSASAPASASSAPQSAPASAPASSAANSAAASNVAVPATTVDTTGAGAVKTLAAMNAALLTVSEVGDGFTQNPPTPERKHSNLCGGLTTDQLFPNKLQAKLKTSKGHNSVDESLELFSDAATVTKRIQADASELDCARAKGMLGGTAMTVGKAQDVTATVGGSAATAWEFTGKGFHALVFEVQVNSALIGYSFFAADGTDARTAPELTSLAKKGTERVIAAGLS